MAVVGHAHIVVRALTDRVQGDIERGFKGASNSSNKAGKDLGDSLGKGIGASLRKNNPFGQIASQLADLYPEAIRASQSFTSLARRGYVVQAAIGAIAGSIGAAVGGLGALIGAAGGAAASLVAVAGAAVTLGVGLKIASFAMKGISQAVSQATQANGGYSKSLKQIKFDAEEAALSVTRAELNLEKAREGLARVADLAPNNRVRREAQLAVREAELALRKAKDADKNPDSAGTDPFAGLTPAQKQFATFLTGLQPKFDALREAAAKGFLPILEEQIKKLINGGLFEVLERRFYDVAKGAGLAVENFTDIFLAGDNLSDFDKILGNIAETLPKIGTVFGNSFGSFLSIMEAADPLTRRFVEFLEAKTGQFAKFLDAKQATGELTTFFNKAGDLGAMFGKIFGNIFGGLGSLIEANFGPGSGGYTLLEWLDKATAGWRNLDLIAQEKYFKGAADNFIAMGDAIGGAIESIIKQGSNPAIAEFWGNLDAGSQSFDTIIRNAITAAPALGDFLRVMTDISALLTDTQTAATFFETLTFFANGAKKVLETLKPLLDFVGPFFAAFSAIKLVQGSVALLGLIIKGFGISALASLGTVAGMFGITLPASMAATKTAVMTTAAGTVISTGVMNVALGTTEVATKKATLAMTLFNLTNPVGWVSIAATAIAGLVMVLGGIKNAQMDSAMKGVTQGFKDGASGADIWKSATLAVNDTTKQNIKSVDQMKDGLGKLAKVQKGYSGPNTTLATASTTALADSFEAMGKSLGNLAVTDLPSAQASFKKFNQEIGLNKGQVITALNEMDDYKKTLVEQAEAMGVSVKTTSGAIDMNKLYYFSMGEGEVKTRAAKQALDDFNTSVTNQALELGRAALPLQQSKEETIKWAKQTADSTKDSTDSWKDYYDGQGFSTEKYIADLKKQMKANLTYADDMKKLAAVGGSDLAKYVEGLGKEVSTKLLPDLLDPVKGPKLRADLAEAARLNGKAVADGYASGLSGGARGVSFRAILEGRVPKKDGGYIGNLGRKVSFATGGFVSGAGTARSDSIPAMLSNGEYVVNARATAQNRTLLEAINSNKSVATAPTINMTVNPSAGMDEKALAAEVSRVLAFQIRRGGL
jgi:hypothetical protein